MTKIKANQLEIQEILDDPLAQGTETRKGTFEIATQVEADAGTDTLRMITPGTLSNFSGFNNWIYANNGDDFGTVPQATGTGAIAIGQNTRANATNNIAIGNGAGGGLAGAYNIAVGYNATVGTANTNCIVLGGFANGSQSYQISIGASLISGRTTTDVSHSVKLGHGPAGATQNFLHLFSSGKLELYGEEAQFIFPNYLTGSPPTGAIPSTTIEGGTIYDASTNELKFYNGTAWTALAVDINWLHANNGEDFFTAPQGTGTSSIALGHNASTATATNSIAIGSNATSNSNAVSIGAQSDALVSSSVAVGYAAQAVDGSTVAIGQYASAAGTSSVAIGNSAATIAQQSVSIGNNSDTLLTNQVAIGTQCLAASVNIDATYSVKLGYGEANTNKNMLHLSTKGKLELYGESAQFIMPNYTMTGSPLTVPDSAIEGGVIYDSTVQGLKVYTGASWDAIGGAGSPVGITDIVEDTTPQLGGNLDVNGKSIVSVGAVAIQLSAGGNFTATAGTGADGSFTKIVGGIGGGYAALVGGYSDSGTGGTGGSVKVVGGGGYTNGGLVRIQGGYGEYGAAGSIALSPGYSGAGNDVGVVAIESSLASAYSTELRFNEAATNGTAYVALKAPNDATNANKVWTLPNDVAADVDGQFIKTNSTGVLSFADPNLIGITTVADLTYTLLLTDGNNLVSMTNGSANTLTIPTNASVAFPIGTQILVEQNGAGTTTITSAGSPAVPTINSAGAFFDTASQYTTISLIKKASDTWLIVGDLV